jgi:hypothetical protein
LHRNKIFEKLSKRQRVGWSLSFDNVGSKFEYVRHGGDWRLLVDNLERIRNLINNQGHWGGIHAVYNIYNATKLLELTEFARSQKLTIHWQSLYQPECLDPARLGEDIVALARVEIHSLLDSDWLLDNERQFFETVLQNLQVKQDLRPELRKHIEEIESKYHLDQQGRFALLWPEIDKLCK